MITWTRDSRYVLSGGENNRVHVWRAADGELVKTLKHIASIDGMRMSHQGHLLACGTEAGEIVFWDTADSDPQNWPDTALYVIKQGPDMNHPDGGSDHSDVNSIDWTVDDQFIVTAGRNTLVKRWHVPDLADPDKALVMEYRGFSSSVKIRIFDAVGRQIKV